MFYVASPDTISAYADGGVAQLGKQKGVAVKIFPTHLPVTDATSQLLQMYQFAGNGGGILIDFTPDTAPAFMKAAEAQGIVDKVLWGSSTPIANTFMSGQFSPEFDGHLWIDNEFSNVDPSVGPANAQESGQGRVEGFFTGLKLWSEFPATGCGPGA